MGFRVLDRDRHPQVTDQPLCEVEGVPRHKVRSVGVGGPLRHATWKGGRPKTRPRRPIAGARKGRARWRKVNHTLHAARREFLELGAQRVDGGLLREVDAASSQVLWGSDWHARRGDGRRECALAREELTEKKPLGIQGGNFDWWLKHGSGRTKPLPLGRTRRGARGRAEVYGGAPALRHLRSPSLGGGFAALALTIVALALAALPLAVAVVRRRSWVGVGGGMAVVLVSGLVLVLGLVVVVVRLLGRSRTVGGRRRRHAPRHRQEGGTLQLLKRHKGSCGLAGEDDTVRPPMLLGNGGLLASVGRQLHNHVPRAVFRPGARILETFSNLVPTLGTSEGITTEDDAPMLW